MTHIMYNSLVVHRLPLRNYIDQLSSDTGCEREELQLVNTMHDRDGWRERLMKCRANSTR